jgi:hypothetical protein
LGQALERRTLTLPGSKEGAVDGIVMMVMAAAMVLAGVMLVVGALP